MIANIDVLIFDILGTVVDENGSMRRELVAAVTAAGHSAREGADLATRWSRRVDELVAEIVNGTSEWRPTDALYRQALEEIERQGPSLETTVIDVLARAGHRLRPWPDSVDALGRLSECYQMVALSNANMSMLVGMFRRAGLTWHCVLSGELVHAYKPDPAVYRLALDLLDLDPGRTLMVAAHPWDLRAASGHGLRTAYIKRDGQLQPGNAFDITAGNLLELATHLRN